MLHGCSGQLISDVLFVDCLNMLSMRTIITNKDVALLLHYKIVEQPIHKIVEQPLYKIYCNAIKYVVI